MFIIGNSPVEVNADLTISYDNSNERFVVAMESGAGYFVERGSLVSVDHKYEGYIIDDILNTCASPNTLRVCITSAAMEEIHKIWMANCDLF